MSSIYNKYPPNYCFEGKSVLNLGCGFAKYRAPNVCNVDGYDNCRPDLVWNLEETPLPFDSERFDLIIANHIIEHVQNWWQLFEDCARMLKSNGRMEIWVPGSGTDAIRGFRDHVHEINNCSFFGTFRTYRAGGNAWAMETYLSPANRMKLVDQKLVLEPYWWLHKWPFKHLRLWAVKHLRNVVQEQGFVFRKVTEAEWAIEKENYEQRQRELGEAVSVLSLR